MNRNLILETQGVRGGQSQTKYIGYLMACFKNESHRIIIDDFDGYGTHYKQRPQEIIRIIENGKDLFSGTFDELKEKLK